MPWPWRKKRRIPPRTPIARIRHLYTDYQRQRNLWYTIILSSIGLVCLWVVFRLFVSIEPWALFLPLFGITVSLIQLYRIRGISEALRDVHAIQQQMDRAEAERRRVKAEADEREDAGEPGKGDPDEDPE